MNRRDFLQTAGAVSAGLALPVRRLFALGETTAEGWRTFEVTTRVEVLKPAGPTSIWLPAALQGNAPFQKTLANEFHAEGGAAEIVVEKRDALGIVTAKFPEGVKPVLTLISRASTKGYGVDLSKPGRAPKADQAELDYYRQPTKVIPVDGAVRITALEATQGAKSDIEKAQAIYAWIVVNTYRNPKTRGCGVGDVRSMLEAKDLGGKCADLNALYVALARAANLPARDLYGLRVAP